MKVDLISLKVLSLRWCEILYTCKHQFQFFVRTRNFICRLNDQNSISPKVFVVIFSFHETAPVI